jgi:ribosomal protein L37E
MGAVSIYSRDQRTLEADLAGRGHHVVYRAEETNRCPGCGRAQWHVGRQTAECAFCGTAIALAEAKWVGSAKSAAPVETKKGSNRRRHERVPVADRTLELLIEGSPLEFAIHNLSAGGLMGDAPAQLQAGDSVQVRFEGGLLVPATVKWSADGLIGLAFDSRVLFDTAGVA